MKMTMVFYAKEYEALLNGETVTKEYNYPLQFDENGCTKAGNGEFHFSDFEKTIITVKAVAQSMRQRGKGEKRKQWIHSYTFKMEVS